MLTLENLSKLFDEATLDRARELALNTKTPEDLKIFGDGSALYGRGTLDIEGTSALVSFTWDDSDKGFLSCDCSLDGDSNCIHLATLAVMITDKLTNNKKSLRDNTSPEMLGAIQGYAMAQYGDVQQSEDAVFEAILTINSRKEWSMGFQVGSGSTRRYRVRNFNDFIVDYNQNKKISIGSGINLELRPEAFSQNSLELISLLTEISANHDQYNHDMGFDPGNRPMALTAADIARVIRLHVGRRIGIKNVGTSEISLADVREENPRLSVSIESTDEGNHYLKWADSPSTLMTAGLLYVRARAKVYLTDSKYTHDMGQLARLMNDSDDKYDSRISPADMPAFVRVVRPILLRHCLVTEADDVTTFLPTPGRVEFELYGTDAELRCRVSTEYNGLLYPVNPAGVMTQLFRDVQRERKLIEDVRHYFKPVMGTPGEFYINLNDGQSIDNFLDDGLSFLSEIGTVVQRDSFVVPEFHRAPQFSMSVKTKSSILNIDIDTDSLNLQELKAYLASFKQKKKYHNLPDGSFVAIDPEGAEALLDLTESLGADSDWLESGIAKLPLHRALALNQLAASSPALSLKRDEAFRSIIRDFEMLEYANFNVPKELDKILHIYQRTGFKWFKTLAKLGFGGILADEMGLGKTLQTITFLLSQVQEGATEGKPSIIIVPASLVYNWSQEFARFAPELNVMPVVGSLAERCRQIHAIEENQIVITSYDLLKRDIEEYADVNFYTAIADEAQYIKTPTTKASRSVKLVKADLRFALTGTPIENRLSELHSIFEFIMPGYLGGRKQFRTRFEAPIATGDDHAATRLKDLIRPFVMRRLKADVLTDLPEKHESVTYSAMGEEQRRVYDAHAAQLKISLTGKGGTDFQHNRMAVLAELTRLRQICCDPSLVYDDYKGGSSKLDTCLEMIGDALDGGHKLLVFSQFTSMLDLIADRLQDQEVPYHILTGSTTKINRAAMVESFQTDDVGVFLISLKAGGTGLNLTAADIVIHFDPWWNMAARNQATDRTHRIGQKNNVTVYSLVASDTLEDRIMEMQERKGVLADIIIGGDGVKANDLTKDDLLALLG